MEDEKSSLNYDFNFNLFLAKRLISDTKRVCDHQNAIKWLRFLMNSHNTLAEMHLRNDFMYYLVLNLQEGYLRPPFDVPPPVSKNLTDIANLIPDSMDNTVDPHEVLADLDDNHGKPMIMSKSPDGGEFLSLQPVPKDGSFCYLTITTKKKDN